MGQNQSIALDVLLGNKKSHVPSTRKIQLQEVQDFILSRVVSNHNYDSTESLLSHIDSALDIEDFSASKSAMNGIHSEVELTGNFDLLKLEDIPVYVRRESQALYRFVSAGFDSVNVGG